MFLFNFILSYKIVIDQNNYKTPYEKSFLFPIFMLIYSPHCPHCTAIHPTWEELMKKYEKDKKIMIGDCNDIQFRKECDSIYRTDSFPTFIILTRGRARRIRPERNINSFINMTEKLKLIDFSINCSIFQSEFSEQYPAFILSNSKTNSEKCSQLQKIIKAYPKVSPYLYMNSTLSEEESFVGMSSANLIGKYEGPKEMDSLIDFIKEYMMTPFGAWNYSEASLYSKRIGLFIHVSHNEFVTFSKTIESFHKYFTLCKIDSNKFSSLIPTLKLSKSELPAFAISNKEKTKFFIIKNVIKDPNVKTEIEKGANGELDNMATIDLSSIFPIQKVSSSKKRGKIFQIDKENDEKSDKKENKDQQRVVVINNNNNNERIVVNNEKDLNKNDEKIQFKEKVKKPSKLASGNFKIFIAFAFIVTASAVVGIICFINNTTNKIE